MSLSVRCGQLRGTKLRTMPNIDMRWDAWKELHPDTKERVLGIPDGAGGVAA